MGCRYVEDCAGLDCFPTQLDCECGGCPGSARDPNSPECQCKKLCPDDPAAPNKTQLNPVGCGCECPGTCDAPKAWDAACGCNCPNTCPPDGSPKTVQNPDTCECECPADPCPNDGELRDPDTCACGCPPGTIPDSTGKCVLCNPDTQELCNDVCEDKCTDGKTRQPAPDCGCACVPPKLIINDKCVDCPEDTTHDICDNVCVPKCAPGQVRANDCKCYCPPGTKLIVSGSSSACVNITYNCGPEGCAEAADGSGQYDTLTECNQGCGGPPCYPRPLPPMSQPILCPDGVTQVGLIVYSTFNEATCSWLPTTVNWGIQCPGEGSSSTDGGGSSSSNCCSLANPGPAIFGQVCGATVTLKGTGYAAPCAGHYSVWTWCETCLPGWPPFLKRVDTYIFNPNSCAFELFMDTPDVQACPTAQSSESAGSSTTTGSSAGTSSSATLSSSAESSYSAAPSSSSTDSNSSSSSEDSCAQIRKDFPSGVPCQTFEEALALCTGYATCYTAEDLGVNPCTNCHVYACRPRPDYIECVCCTAPDSQAAKDGYYFDHNLNAEVFFDCATANVDCSKFSSSSQTSSSQTSSTQGSSAQSSSTQSSSSAQINSSQSSSSSASSCPALAVSVGFVVNSNGQFLNNFGPGDTATVSVVVSDIAAAVATNLVWTLKANGNTVLSHAPNIGDANPTQYTLSAEDLLATLNPPLTFENAPLDSYTFNFCGYAVSCAGEAEPDCRGSITVKIPGRSSSGAQSSTTSAASSSSAVVNSSSSGSSHGGQSSSSAAPVSSSSINGQNCVDIFGTTYDGGNANTQCGSPNNIDLGNAWTGENCLNCQAGECA